MTIFIAVDIMEYVVEYVARKFLGSSGPRGTNLEALQGWILKFGDNKKILLTSVETFANFLAKKPPPCAAYFAFMSGQLIVLDKQTGIHLVSVVEIWRWIFAKCVLRFTGSEATGTCQGYHLCSGLKAGVYGTVHGVQAIGETKLALEDWGFILVDAKNAFNNIKNCNEMESFSFMSIRNLYRF